jgi:pimeloyl-ACP methyl ester carboxylesterase
VRIRVGDVSLFFDVDGPQLVPTHEGVVERPTVVLLHAGPGADHSLYKDLVGPQLARIAQVVYVDLRGHGRSDRSDASRWNLETWATDLRLLLDALEIERPMLLGTSGGALVALELAAQHPEIPARLVLASVGARYVHARSVAVFDRRGGHEAGEIAARYFADPNDITFADYLRVCVPLYTCTPLDPDVIARMEINSEATQHWDRHSAQRVDLRAEAGAIRCPTLVLAGEEDPAFSVAGAEELVDCLPRHLVEFLRYPNTGHGIFRDAPAALDDVIQFLTADGAAKMAS